MVWSLALPVKRSCATLQLWDNNIARANADDTVVDISFYGLIIGFLSHELRENARLTIEPERMKIMEIFNMVRGHFALLINKPFKTPAQGKEFTIAKVSTKEGDWQIVLKISTGNYAKVYISDILRVYTFIVSSNRPLSQAEVDDYVQKACLTNGITPYVIPLIGTFSDIKISREPQLTIEFIPLREML